MNDKGQIGGLGSFITIFIVIIVGATLFITIAQNIGTVTNTRVLINESFVTGANATATAIPGQGIVGSLILTNQTGQVIGTGNYTTANRQVLNGVYTATLTITNASYASLQTYINATVEPDGYLENSGSRSVASIVILLTALGIGIVTLVPSLRSKLFEIIGR